MLKKCHIHSNSFIGVFSTASESVAVIPKGPEMEMLAKMTPEVLNVDQIIRTNVDSSNLIGAFISMNSNGAVVYPFIQESELALIQKAVPVTKLTEKFNAAGNNILVNDNGALVHPSFNDATVERIAKALDVPVKKGTVAGFNTVGSAAVVTNKAAICHPHTSDWEMGIMEEIFQVDVSICTANYGSGLLGASIMANTKGALVGKDSTPIELGKVEEGLKLY